MLIDFCVSVDNNGRCTECSNFRAPSPQTQYGLCYPRNCLVNIMFNCPACRTGYVMKEGNCLAAFC